MAYVQSKMHEPIDVTIRRFKRACEKDGIMGELRKRQAYEKPTAARKRLASAARKRLLKLLSRGRVSSNTRARGGFGGFAGIYSSSPVSTEEKTDDKS